MALWSPVLPFPPFTSHPSAPSNGIFEMLTPNLAPTGDWSLFLLNYSQLQQGKHWFCSAVMGQARHLWTPVSQGSSISCTLLPLCRFYTSISLPTASMACQIHALSLPSDALLLFHLSTHSPVWFQCQQHQPGLKAGKLSPYFNCLPPP